MLKLRGLYATLTLILIINLPGLAHAQGKEAKAYRSESLGVSFAHPTEWTVTELTASNTVLAGTESDLALAAQGGKPAGLIFSVALSSFRQIGVQSPDDFPQLMAKLNPGESLTPDNVTLGGAPGLALLTTSTPQDLASYTAILSIGQRRVAVVRGFATMSGWLTDGKMQLEEILASLAFFPPQGSDLDAVGRAFWNLALPDWTAISDLAISSDGSTLYIADRNRGVLAISASGTVGSTLKPAEIVAFGGVISLRGGAFYIADPGTRAIWRVDEQGKPARLNIAAVASFGNDSPRLITSLGRSLLALDENPPRLLIIDVASGATKILDLLRFQPEPIQGALLAIDSEGTIYILGRNTGGIYRINSNGAILKQNIGAGLLAGSEPLAFAIDRFGNFYVATGNQGIFHLDSSGALIGVIGQPYDGATPPKEGQIARPIAIALTPDGGPLYVVDGGKYPQLVAFALDTNTAASLAAGTLTMGEIADGQTVTGEITAKTFVYAYQFSGKRGDVVTITMKADPEASFDTYIDLVGPDDRRVARNDDAKESDLGAQDSRIKEFTLPANGLYTIRATRFGRETTRAVGKFSLTFERKPSLTN